MIDPHTVNPSNFQVDRVVFDDGEFSIAWGTWEDNTQRLGMRWNGNDAGDPGYPKLFRNPVWFVLPVALSHSLLTGALLGLDGTNAQELLAVLNGLFGKSTHARA